MIQVTKPFFPPVEEYKKMVDSIWNEAWITNDGPFVKKLEKELERYLKIDHLSFLSNGTIALQLAIKALNLKEEIITTPFSYVATSSSIVWENCKPVFVDIDEDTFNIDPLKIEEKITSKTTGIVATHIFGNPCDIDKIKEIADKYNLKVIYDAAHCFGSKFKGKSVFKYGDISTVSFHATKLFHTAEGGATICNTKEMAEKIGYLRNFGHSGTYDYNGIGINGKNSELHAAIGVLNLKYADRILAQRKKQYLLYKDELSCKGLQFQKIQENSNINYSYFPIRFKSEAKLLDAEKKLADKNIFTRRYFYPSLNTLSYLSGRVPVSERVACTILCLPLYHELTEKDQYLITGIINSI